MAKSKTHEVKKGENLIKIAKKHGIKEWKKLWAHKDNKALNKQRGGDAKKIQAGDKIALPGDLLAQPEPKYAVALGSKTFAIAPDQIKILQKSLVDQMKAAVLPWLHTRVISARAMWDHYDKANDEKMVMSWVKEAVSGAKFPPEGIIKVAEGLYKSAEAAVNSGDLLKAHVGILAAEGPVNAAFTIMVQYGAAMTKGVSSVTPIKMAKSATMEAVKQVAAALKAGAKAIDPKTKVIEGAEDIVKTIKKDADQALSATQIKEFGEVAWDTIAKAVGSSGVGKLLSGPKKAQIIDGVSLEIIKQAPSWILSKVISGQKQRIDFVKKLLLNHYLPTLQKVMESVIKVVSIVTKPAEFLVEIAKQIVNSGFLKDLEDAIVKLLPLQIIKQIPKKIFEENFLIKKGGKLVPAPVEEAAKWLGQLLKQQLDILQKPFDALISKITGSESVQKIIDLLAKLFDKSIMGRIYKEAKKKFAT